MNKQEIQRHIKQFLDRYGVDNFRPKATFFDMDGVLYDSMPHHERSWLEAARHANLRMTSEDVYMAEGQTGRTTIEQLMQATHQRSATEEEIKLIYAHKTELFTRYNQGELIPGVGKVLEAVSGLRRVVVTGSSQASLLERVETNFPNVFAPSDFVTGRDVRFGKPHPEPYLKALELAGVAPYEALVVENAPRGVRAAHEAGCFTIAVNTGPLRNEVLWQEGADLLFGDMHELAQALRDIIL